MHSHVVEFLSAVFARFNVTFYLEYHCTAVSEVSRGKKWSVNPFQTPKVQETEYTYSSANFRNYEKKNWVILQNLHTLKVTLMFRNEHRWNLIFFLAWHVIESLLHKEELSLIFSAKKLICIGETSVPQLTQCLLSDLNKRTAELSLGSSRNTLSRRAQMSTEICIKLFKRRRIKRRNRLRSFLISLNFYQTTLESSPQTRFMFDIKKFNIINRCANIYSWRNTGWPQAVENCDQFAWIPLNSQSRSHY